MVGAGERERDKLRMMSRFLACESAWVMELFLGVCGPDGEITFSG